MRFFVFVKKIKGFTLLELLIVLSILTLIIAIAMPRYRRVSDLSEKEACRFNCELAEDTWKMRMAQEPEINDEARMKDVILEIGELCPVGGVVIRIENTFICMLHDERSEQIENVVLEDACAQNRKQLYEEYQVYLHDHGHEHDDIKFQQFLDWVDKQTCPTGGELFCDGMGIDCSIHVGDEDTPFL